jgi:glyoxylase-like metal-dependent hydrolase (beta-lactamase superfamily II)
MPGHIMLLVRVKIQDTEGPGDFVLLSGDCFHHSALLRDPQLTARPPFSKRTTHEDPGQAFNTIQRTAKLAKQPNIWVIGAHDAKVAKVAQAIGTDEKDELLGLAGLQDWRKNGWKGDQGSY